VQITGEVQNLLSSMTSSVQDLRSGLFDSIGNLGGANAAAGASTGLGGASMS
jgi:hypothetical protein